MRKKWSISGLRTIGLVRFRDNLVYARYAGRTPSYQWRDIGDDTRDQVVAFVFAIQLSSRNLRHIEAPDAAWIVLADDDAEVAMPAYSPKIGYELGGAWTENLELKRWVGL